MKTFTFMIWAGRIALVAMVFLIVDRLGPGALWWAAPLLFFISVGCYAEQGKKSLRDLQNISESIDQLLVELDQRRNRP